ncbi:LIRP [Orussus abietinus]|uniref:LIRP n=1 Tax=Orussus abietinus TaxID=222816 RepID=UPI0006267182|nr:LIRP [Orussus abietinus]
MVDHPPTVILAMGLVGLVALLGLGRASGQLDAPWEPRYARSGAVSKYCGRHLSTALQLVCKGNYNSMFKKSIRESGTETDTEAAEYEDDVGPNEVEPAEPFLSRTVALAMAMAMASPRAGGRGRWLGDRDRDRFRRAARGVHDECCLKPCSISQLASYCAR